MDTRIAILLYVTLGHFITNGANPGARCSKWQYLDPFWNQCLYCGVCPPGSRSNLYTRECKNDIAQCMTAQIPGCPPLVESLVCSERLHSSGKYPLGTVCRGTCDGKQSETTCVYDDGPDGEWSPSVHCLSSIPAPLPPKIISTLDPEVQTANITTTRIRTTVLIAMLSVSGVLIVSAAAMASCLLLSCRDRRNSCAERIKRALAIGRSANPRHTVIEMEPCPMNTLATSGPSEYPASDESCRSGGNTTSISDTSDPELLILEECVGESRRGRKPPEGPSAADPGVTCVVRVLQHTRSPQESEDTSSLDGAGGVAGRDQTPLKTPHLVPGCNRRRQEAVEHGEPPSEESTSGVYSDSSNTPTGQPSRSLDDGRRLEQYQYRVEQEPRLQFKTPFNVMTEETFLKAPHSADVGSDEDNCHAMSVDGLTDINRRTPRVTFAPPLQPREPEETIEESDEKDHLLGAAPTEAGLDQCSCSSVSMEPEDTMGLLQAGQAEQRPSLCSSVSLDSVCSSVLGSIISPDHEDT